MLQAKFPGTLNLASKCVREKAKNCSLDELVEDHDPEQEGHVGD
jgi:hypothetical protein